MDQYPYLRIRFERDHHLCGVTLSLPEGVARALSHGRLPDDAEALVTDTGAWVPLAEHPAMAAGPEQDEPGDPGVTRWRRHLQAVQRWAAAL